MTFRHLAALLLIFAVTESAIAIAAETTTKPPVTASAPTVPPSTGVDLNAQDIAVLAAALSNAGAACDANVQVYCQIVQFRAALDAKMTAASAKLNQPVEKK